MQMNVNVTQVLVYPANRLQKNDRVIVHFSTPFINNSYFVVNLQSGFGADYAKKHFKNVPIDFMGLI